MKAIVHIGMHKTGTSSIQASFTRKRPAGFAYYSHIGTNLNVWSRHMFEEPEVRRLLPKLANATEADLDAIRQDEMAKTDAFLEGCTEDAVILSAERFTLMSAPAVQAFADWAQSRFSSIEVYAYVRDPLGFCRSALQQRAKAIAPKMEFHVDYPTYQERFEKFETSFGADHVHYRLFRRNDLIGNNVVVDFADWLGSEYAAEDIVSENESMSIEALAFIVLLNQGDRMGFQTLNRSQGMNEVVADIMSFGKGKWHYSKAVQDKIISDIAEDCAWMESRVGEPLIREDSSSGVEIGSVEDLVRIGQDTFDAMRAHLLDRRFPAPEGSRRATLQNFNILKSSW